jgi:hypothetical protein
MSDDGGKVSFLHDGPSLHRRCATAAHSLSGGCLRVRRVICPFQVVELLDREERLDRYLGSK